MVTSSQDDGIPDLDVELLRWDQFQMGVPVKNRFDSLPIHKLCYYHARWSSTSVPGKGAKSVVEEMKHLIQRETHERNERYGDDYRGSSSLKTSRKDCMGMTPLHILALSNKPNLELWNTVYEAFPRDLLVKDREAKEPMTFLWDAPPAQGILRHAIKARHQERLQSLCLERWRLDVLQSIQNISMDSTESRQRDSKRICSLLFKYERMEGLSLLESAIWKAQWQRIAIIHMSEPTTATVTATKDMTLGANQTEEEAEVGPEINLSTGSPNFFISREFTTSRETCRLQCGSDIVVSNVRPFLASLYN